MEKTMALIFLYSQRRNWLPLNAVEKFSANRPLTITSAVFNLVSLRWCLSSIRIGFTHKLYYNSSYAKLRCSRWLSLGRVFELKGGVS